MSEVIVRIETPKGCASCPMADDESRFCKAAKEYIPMLGKPSWCPIVGELPEQHGRLIDASTVLFEAEESDGVAPPKPVTVDDYLVLFDLPTIVPATERRR